jgi:hypothetical protein
MKVPTRGGRPNTAFIRSSLPHLLNDAGQVRVKHTLQSVDYPDIFAIGDCTDWKEQKQSGKYYSHVSVCVANALAYLKGEKPAKIYKGRHVICDRYHLSTMILTPVPGSLNSYELIVITNGRVSCSSISGDIKRSENTIRMEARLISVSCGVLYLGTGFRAC